MKDYLIVYVDHNSDYSQDLVVRASSPVAAQVTLISSPYVNLKSIQRVYLAADLAI